MVECVRLPLVPVIVTVKVPVAVPPPEPVNVSVEVAVPPLGGVTVAGLKLAVTPAGSAPFDSETVLPLKPFTDVIVTVVDVEPDLVIFRLVGDALMEKSPVTGAVTVIL